jgi:hypothetical protein
VYLAARIRWFRELTQEEVYFVTRMKEKAVYEAREELEIPQNSNVVRDQIVCFPRLAREGEDPVLFRRVEIWDEEKQEALVFLSNSAGLRRDDHRGHLQGPLASGIVFQGAEADIKDQDVCGDQRQCGPNPGVDGVDRDAGAEVPAVEIARSHGRYRRWPRCCGNSCSSIATCTMWLDDPFQSPPALAGVHDDAQQLAITW